MAEAARLICASTELANGGKGVRFEIQTAAGMQAAFVVRYGGSVFGFLNRCAHIGIELDWQPGEFFDESGLYCASHGSLISRTAGASQAMSGPAEAGHFRAGQVAYLLK